MTRRQVELAHDLDDLALRMAFVLASCRYGMREHSCRVQAEAALNEALDLIEQVEEKVGGAEQALQDGYARR